MFKVQRQKDYLSDQRCVGERWSDVGVLVELILIF